MEEKQTMFGKLRSFTDDDKLFVLETRNLPSVRRNMYNSEPIELADHEQWWERLKQDGTKQYFIYEKDQQKLGVVGFYNISQANQTAEWAFYATEDAPRGTGSLMEYLALTKAFEELNLRKLSCEVLSYNPAVVRLHRKYGFMIEGIKRHQHLFEGKLHDIYMLAMEKKAWDRHLKKHAESALVVFNKDNTWVGKKFESTFTVTQADIDSFAEISGDKNPIHLSAEAAKSAGFNGCIAHGALFIGFISKLLGMDFPGQGTIIAKQDFQFLAPIYPNEKVPVTLECVSQVGKKLMILFSGGGGDVELKISGQVEVVVQEL